MRVRLFELRLMAIALTVLWAVGGGIVLIAYRPGGPVDVFVGVAAMLPLLVSAASIVWPPLVRGGRDAAVVFWIGFAAVLLLMPSIAGITTQIITRGAEPLLPSLEVIYPWFLALLATGLFAGLGVTRQLFGEVGARRKRVVASLAISIVSTAAIGGVFAGVSLADDAALRDRPATTSRFGPTGAAPAPPSCTGALKLATTAHLELDLWGNVDGKSIGDVSLTGVRSGTDVSWTAQVVRSDLFGEYGVVRDGAIAWQLDPGEGWRGVVPAATANALVDATVFEVALSAGNRSTAEELGLEYVERARARHCRVAVDGPQFVAAFPQARYLIGKANPTIWRGTINYWVFGDGEVGKITGAVNGDAQGILPGVNVNVLASMTATYRDEAVAISPPR